MSTAPPPWRRRYSGRVDLAVAAGRGACGLRRSSSSRSSPDSSRCCTGTPIRILLGRRRGDHRRSTKATAWVLVVSTDHGVRYDVLGAQLLAGDARRSRGPSATFAQFRVALRQVSTYRLGAESSGQLGDDDHDDHLDPDDYDDREEGLAVSRRLSILAAVILLLFVVVAAQSANLQFFRPRPGRFASQSEGLASVE